MNDSIDRREFVRLSTLFGMGFALNVAMPRPNTAMAAAASDKPVVLTSAEWKTIEAITARIIPTDHEPGALEANCINFIDKALANEDEVARPLYQLGAAEVNKITNARYGSDFLDADVEEQDALLSALESGRVSEWSLEPIPQQVFFETVRIHTIIGFLADPKYGGNRDYVGWRVSGYPGPRHMMGGYSAEQMSGAADIVPVWKA